jgi:hypothetical protein
MEKCIYHMQVSKRRRNVPLACPHVEPDVHARHGVYVPGGGVCRGWRDSGRETSREGPALGTAAAALPTGVVARASFHNIFCQASHGPWSYGPTGCGQGV